MLPITSADYSPVDLLLDGLVGHDGDGGVLVVLPPREPRHDVGLVARPHPALLQFLVSVQSENTKRGGG